MLKVKCAASGRVRLVKTNSVTGEVTEDRTFNNTWTDYGLSRISGYSTESSVWPNAIRWGDGLHSEPYSAVTALANQVGAGSVSFSGSGSIEEVGDVCVVTRTRSATQSARGVPWNLRELGVSYGGSASLDTYAAVRDENGDIAPFEVSGIEIVTIYYTLQIQYPMSMAPMPVSGMPGTTAEFTLRPDVPGFAGSAIGQVDQTNASFRLAGYASDSFLTKVTSTGSDGDWSVWGINTMNRTTEYFGSNVQAANHLWKLDPPITKDDTQELRLKIYWGFTNASPVGVE